MTVFNSRCVKFGGTNKYVDMGSVLGFERTNAFSLCVWVKVTVQGMLVAKMAGATAYRGYRFYVANTGKLNFQLVNDIGSGNYLNVDSAVCSVFDGKWHHAVVTYSGNSLVSGVTFYLDGAAIGKTTLTDALTATIVGTTSFELGAYNGPNAVLTGYLDEAAVYDKELSAAEVTWIYNSGVPCDLAGAGCPSNLNAWWRMGDGDTYPAVLDQTTNNLDGTMTNMAVTDLFGDAPAGAGGYESAMGGGGSVVTAYYKMRAQDSGASPPGYVTWLATGSPDFAGAGYASGTPTPVGVMVVGSATVSATWEE